MPGVQGANATEADARSPRLHPCRERHRGRCRRRRHPGYRGAARIEKAKVAEGLIQELHASLTDAQKKNVLLPFDHGAKGGTPTRLGMYNSALLDQKIGTVYTKGQQELIEKILRSMVSGEEGYKRISRNGTWDTTGSLQNCGSLLFGQPEKGKKYAWVFTGHHLTIRADGDFRDGSAWGGPMYYGHSPNGYSDKNVFNYQTKSVLEVFKALDGKQRDKAIVVGSPGEQAPSVRFRKRDEAKPGILAQDLSKDQRALIETVMRDLLSPYRKEDGDEVMEILKANGGLDKLHLAFYRDKGATDNEQWHFWRWKGRASSGTIAFCRTSTATSTSPTRRPDRRAGIDIALSPHKPEARAKETAVLRWRVRLVPRSLSSPQFPVYGVLMSPR